MLAKGVQLGAVRLQPQLAANWLSRELGTHDFGVPPSAVAPGRPAYELGSTWSYELGLGGFVELTDSWLLAVSLADDTVIKGFTALVRTF